MITPAMIKQLREQTGAGFGDVKAALTEANGDMEEATKILRKKGLAAASKKAGRVTAEGAVVAHVQGDTGVLVEVNCETDFVGRNENFRAFAEEVASAVAQSSAENVDDFLNENWPDSSETVSHHVAEKIADACLEGYNLAEERYIGVEDKGDRAEQVPAPADVPAEAEQFQAAPAV